jgi:hypothetical protein
MISTTLCFRLGGAPARARRFVFTLPLVALIASGCATGNEWRTSGTDPFARGGGAPGSTSALDPAGTPLPDSVTALGTIFSGGEGGGAALDNATVRLLGVQEALVAEARSDSAGTFRLGPARAGTYTLLVTVDGHKEIRERIDFVGRAPATLRLEMARDADSGRSSATFLSRRDPLEYVGFYQRRGREAGTFLAYDQVRTRGAASPSRLLLMIPGFAEGVDRLGNPVVVGRRGCPPTLFVDGQETGTVSQIDFLVTLFDIMAIEAYPGSSPPAQFAGINGPCGAVVIWTPRG